MYIKRALRFDISNQIIFLKDRDVTEEKIEKRWLKLNYEEAMNVKRFNSTKNDIILNFKLLRSKVTTSRFDFIRS